MKKLLCSFALVSMLAMPAFANDFVCEPESDTAVSYAAYDVLSGEWETTFVNYVNADETHEYWLRLAFRGRTTKVLHYCTLEVDGENYRLTAIPFDDKHYYAAQSISLNKAKAGQGGDEGILLVTAPRYYPLTKEMAGKLVNAKKIKLTVQRLQRINTELIPNDKMMKDLKKAYTLGYADFENEWKPKDTGKK